MFHINVISLLDKPLSRHIFKQLDAEFRNNYKDMISRRLGSSSGMKHLLPSTEATPIPNISISYLQIDKIAPDSTPRVAADAYIIISEFIHHCKGESLTDSIMASSNIAKREPFVLHKTIRFGCRRNKFTFNDSDEANSMSFDIRRQPEPYSQLRRSTISHVGEPARLQLPKPQIVHEDIISESHASVETRPRRATFSHVGEPARLQLPKPQIVHEDIIPDSDAISAPRPRATFSSIRRAKPNLPKTWDDLDVGKTGSNVENRVNRDTGLLEYYLGRWRNICSLQNDLIGRLDVLNSESEKMFHQIHIIDQQERIGDTKNAATCNDIGNNSACKVKKTSTAVAKIANSEYKFHKVLSKLDKARQSNSIDDKLNDVDAIDEFAYVDVQGIFDELLDMLRPPKPKRRHTGTSVMNKLAAIKNLVASRITFRRRSNTII